MFVLRGFKRLLLLGGILLGAATALYAHVMPLVSRDADYHRYGAYVFRQDNADKWGGVIMQGTGMFVYARNKSISPGEITLSTKTNDPRGFCVVYKTNCYWVVF